jgi:hypothetical protein
MLEVTRRPLTPTVVVGRHEPTAGHRRHLLPSVYASGVVGLRGEEGYLQPLVPQPGDPLAVGSRQGCPPPRGDRPGPIGQDRE